jgi:hypothetical protein
MPPGAIVAHELHVPGQYYTLMPDTMFPSEVRRQREVIAMISWISNERFSTCTCTIEKSRVSESGRVRVGAVFRGDFACISGSFCTFMHWIVCENIADVS